MMIQDFREESAIFLSVLRWLLLALIIGTLVGSATALFLKCLVWSDISHYPYYFWLLPLAMFLSVIMVKYIAPDATGHGTEKVIEAVHRQSGRIKPLVVPVKLVATIITIASGGSVGKEGPSAQIGAGLASLFSDVFRLKDEDRKKLVICGISAGFAAVFGTPISGAVFGIEVLFIGAIMYDVLLPSFIAGIISYHIAAMMGVHYVHQTTEFQPIFSQSFFGLTLLAGIFFGLVSFLMIKMMGWTERLAGKIHIWAPLKGLVGGMAIIILCYVFSTDYLGLGINEIEYAIRGGDIIWYAFLLKIAFTCITLNFGGSGGIATSLFFIGATSGVMFAHLFGLDSSTFAAIGFVAVLGGATNAPLAASIMALEMFGPNLAPYAAIAIVISFLMTGHRSVYPSQVLAIRKSAYVNVELGKKLDEIDHNYDFSYHSSRQVVKMRKRLRKTMERRSKKEKEEKE